MPQHNGWAKRRHGELKAESGLGRGVVPDCVEEVAVHLAAARDRLNNHRLQSRLGCRAAAEIDRMLPLVGGCCGPEGFP